MTAHTYGWLMAGGGGEAFDRHLFACVVAIARTTRTQPLAVNLGLSAEALAALVGIYFPHAPSLLSGLDPTEDGMAPQTADEFALRQLLMDCRSQDSIEQEWLAHILARRTLSQKPLWQEMGLSHRADLSLLMTHHFAPLAARNQRDMRWKPFFWRELEIAGGLDCQAETQCPQCRRFTRCFDPELGTSVVLSEPRHAG